MANERSLTSQSIANIEASQPAPASHQQRTEHQIHGSNTPASTVQ
jgi:hypothetical protein